jgi:hypothetical protein
MAEGFSSLDFLYGGLGKSRKKERKKISSVILYFFQFLVIKDLDLYPDPDPDSLTMLDPDPDTDFMNPDPKHWF